MAYENIRFKKQNVVVVNGYFFMFDEDTDSLIQKTDDGSQAFSYPLSTTLTNQIISLEYDGANFWTLEDPGANNMIIRRWYLSNYICKLRNTFNLVESGSHKYDSQAFTVEHYHIAFSGDEGAGQSNLSISNGSKLSSGMTIILGPNSSGQTEECSVNSAGADYVNINGTTSYAYSTGDSICFYKNIWMFNNYDGVDSGSGALYKLNAYTGSYVSKTAGGEFQDIKACTFYDMSSVFGAGSEAICYVKTTNMIFLDPDDLSAAIGSMVMDNIEDDNATVIIVYDVTIEGSNIYRLQLKATYYGTTYSFTDNLYSYQLSTSNSFITSISLSAAPAILPANGINDSTITAIVKNQFLQAVSGRLVSFSEDDPDGFILAPTQVATDANGVATAVYNSGVTAREVKCTATAQQS